MRKVLTLVALGAVSTLPFLAMRGAHADMTARRASDFVDSVGVSTQFWVNTGGGRYGTDAPTVLQKIKALNMRYYRGYYQNSYRDYGLKGFAYVDTRTNGALDANGINATLDRYNGYESELIAVEGPNEYDLTGRPNWAAEMKPYLLSLKNAVRARAAYNNAVLLGPSLFNADNFAQLGNVTDRSEVANAHAYSGQKEPEAWWYEDPNQGYFIDAWSSRAANAYPGKPMWVTETGYNSVSDDVKAKYVPRHYLWFFMRGVPRTSTFEMIDSPGGHNWGLLRTDLSEKPCYTSLKNMMSVLNDSNSSFTPGTLGYSIAGDMTNIRQCLLQKGDGTYELMLWQSTRGWNDSTSVETPVPDRSLTLNITSSVGVVNTYLPKNGAGVVNTYNSPSSISLSVPDHVLIVELKPGNSVPPNTTNFSTTFESGQPQPTWNDSVDSSNNVGGFQAGVNPECSTRANEPGISGTALMYSGRGNANAAFCYYRVFSTNISIGSSTTLSYDIYPQYDNGRYVGVDFLCSDGTVLRDSGAVDSNGITFHPNAGHGGNIPLNAWTTIRGTIGNKLAGKTITKIWVAFDRSTNANSQYRGYIDNIRISSGSNAPIGRRISLNATVNGKYVCADNYGANPLIANRTSVGAWESFDVVDGGGGFCALKAVANGKFVSAPNGGWASLVASATAISNKEQFGWVTNSDNTISLQSASNNQYVTADNYGANPLLPNSTSIGGWQKFTFAAQ